MNIDEKTSDEELMMAYQQGDTLALLSMGVFICTGAGVVAGLRVFWVLGSILGGLGTFELGWAIRRRIRARSYV